MPWNGSAQTVTKRERIDGWLLLTAIVCPKIEIFRKMPKYVSECAAARHLKAFV